jgi:hypothetical protein
MQSGPNLHDQPIGVAGAFGQLLLFFALQLVEYLVGLDIGGIVVLLDNREGLVIGEVNAGLIPVVGLGDSLPQIPHHITDPVEPRLGQPGQLDLGPRQPLLLLVLLEGQGPGVAHRDDRGVGLENVQVVVREGVFVVALALQQLLYLQLELLQPVAQVLVVQLVGVADVQQPDRLLVGQRDLLLADFSLLALRYLEPIQHLKEQVPALAQLPVHLRALPLEGVDLDAEELAVDAAQVPFQIPVVENRHFQFLLEGDQLLARHEGGQGEPVQLFLQAVDDGLGLGLLLVEVLAGHDLGPELLVEGPLLLLEFLDVVGHRTGQHLQLV